MTTSAPALSASGNATENAYAATVAPTAVEHEESILGFGPPGIVALSMVVVILIMLWKGVPKMIAGGLDKKIATIRKQLDEAASLRAEAEAMRAEYQAKAAQAHKDAEAIVEHARIEAAQLVEQAKQDADLLIERRGKMAEDKLAAAERAALAEVRARVASAAASAAATIIAQRHDANADKALIERTISSLN